jgi:hypothetical protein
LRNKAQNNTSAGNDIRDEFATSGDWSLGTAIELCSTANKIRFSCGTADSTGVVSDAFEVYLPDCFNNPCLNLDLQLGDKCPLECEQQIDEEKGENFCAAGYCTRLHYENTCYTDCMMVFDQCVYDPCMSFDVTSECTYECKWQKLLIDGVMKDVCKAHDCTRMKNESNFVNGVG